MNEISPTAKAAKTVVLTESASGKTSELVALEVGVEAGGVLRGGRRRPRTLGAAPPSQRGDGDGAEGGEQRQGGHQVGGEIEALARRQREHAVAVLAHERRLDLRLRLALRDQRRDESALPLRLRRVGGHLERLLALEAHHLVLDIRERRPGARGRGRGRDREHQQRHAEDRHASHVASPSRGTTFSWKKRSSTGPRAAYTIRPR